MGVDIRLEWTIIAPILQIPAPILPISTLSFPALYPVIPAKAGIQRLADDAGVARALVFSHIRIRIYGIIGFSGFVRRVFVWRALACIRPGGISCYGENFKPGETKS